jgi:hypothetical protein
MALMDDNSLAFSILVSTDIEASLILNIAESFISIGKDLEPSRVGAPDLHVLSLTGVFNIPRLVVQLGSDGQGLLMEVPCLSISSIWCLNDHVSVVDQIKVSV